MNFWVLECPEACATMKDWMGMGKRNDKANGECKEGTASPPAVMPHDVDVRVMQVVCLV